MSAKLGHDPSYCWKDIFETTKLLKEGCHWRVEDGKSINIWNDYWVPGFRKLGTNLVNPQSRNNMEMEVDLIDQDTGWWNVDRVQHIFPTYIASEVLKIMIPSKGHPDSIFWEPEKHGTYTVSSAYRMRRKMVKNATIGECSNQVDKARWWKLLWGLKIPRKIKVIARRLCHENLPTRQKL